MDKSSIFIEIKRPSNKKQESINSKFQIKKNSKFVLDEEENFFCFESKKSFLNEASTYYNDKTYRNIFDITFDDDCLKMSPCFDSEIYHVLKNNEDHGMKIKKNDVLKIANRKIKILYYSMGENSKKERKSNYMTTAPSFFSNSLGPKITHPFCKICLEDNISIGNILVKACSCEKGNQYIHSSCLKDYIKKNIKINEQTKDRISYNPEMIICEECGFQLPVTLKLVCNFVDLLEIHNIFDKYLLVQIDDMEIIALNLEGKKEIKIGSDFNDDIFLNNPNIEGYHCKLSIKNETFFVKNMNSSFCNVSLLVDKPIFIHKKEVFKIGEDLVNVQKKTKKYLFFFC